MLVSLNLAGDTVSQNSDQCHQHTKAKSVCNTDASCSFHLCGHGATATILLLSYAHIPYRYEHLEKPVLTSRFFSPAIKPPIVSQQT